MERAPIKTLPSAEELRALLSYDEQTGDLRWKRVRARAHRIKVGEVAGSMTDRGYLAVGIRRRQYLAHRVIWKMVTGSDPVDQIDHVDGNRTNNRLANLRPATNGQNRYNTKLAKNNKSGVKGVSWDRGRAWVSYITAGGPQIRLGRFKNKNDAILARCSAEAQMHGEFARI